MHPRNCFCHLDTVPLSIQVIFLKERENQQWILMQKIFTDGKRAVILSVNIARDSQHKLTSLWLHFRPTFKTRTL